MNIFGLHCYISLVFVKILKNTFSNTDSLSLLPKLWLKNGIYFIHVE